MRKYNLQYDFSLKSSNTFGSDYKAERYLEIYDVQELYAVLVRLRLLKTKKLVIGNGSNILFTKDYEGLVLKIVDNAVEILFEKEDCVTIRAMAGLDWHWFVQYCVKKEIYGIENLALIPGSVGASVVQNIGAYGVEVSSVVFSVAVLDLATGCTNYLSNEQCKFGYRDSLFKHNSDLVVLYVDFQLSKKPQLFTSYGSVNKYLEDRAISTPTAIDVFNAIVCIRKERLPDFNVENNAGSFFKNPLVSKETLSLLQKDYCDISFFRISDEVFKLSAAWLIEKCGWKGIRMGDVGISKRHSLVLVRYDNGTGFDVYMLSQEIIKSVNKKFGIILDPEVCIF